jgi:hypothetical protein
MSESNNIEFLISNLSLPKPLMTLGSVAAHERYVEAAGADGMELTPVNISRFMGRLLYRAKMLEEIFEHPVPTVDREYLFDQLGYDIHKDWTDEDEAFERLVRSQHSSFRGDTYDNGIVARTVPTWRESLVQMRKIQLITGRLTAVLYPGFEGGEVVYDADNAPFAERTFQPKASEWQHMGLTEHSTITDIEAAITTRGFTAITYDVLHCQVEEAGCQFEDPLGLAERLAAGGLVKSIHLSVNRLDIAGLHSPLAKSTKNARKAFVRSAEAASKTLEGEILTTITHEWRQGNMDGRIIIEDGPLRLGNVRRDHAAIMAHARELVAG